MSRGMFCLAAGGLLCVALPTLPGCVFVSENSRDAQNATVGRELRDLKMARDNGALDEREYHDARQKVLARLDKPCKSN